MALKVPYATVSEANSFLSESDSWSDLTTSEKEIHLLNGRYFLDSYYTCTLEDENNIPDEFAYANSLLAEIDLNTGLFIVDKTIGNAVVKKRSVAGDVESEITYSGSRSTVMHLNSIDSYPQVTSILSEYCSITNSSMNNVNLLRT